MAGRVIDASVAVKWFLEEDRSREARVFLANDEVLLAPAFLLPELAHALWSAVRGGRTPPQAVPAALTAVRGRFDRLTPDPDLIDEAADLMLGLNHPVYDCLYLALASREKATLVTADERLFAVARRARISAERL